MKKINLRIGKKRVKLKLQTKEGATTEISYPIDLIAEGIYNILFLISHGKQENLSQNTNVQLQKHELELE